MVGTLGPGVGYGRAARFMYIATAGQTTFTGADSSAQALTMNYTAGYVEVSVNGLWLPPTDYTATNGSSVVFPSGAAAGDIIYVYVLSVLSVANTYDKTQNGADILDKVAFRVNTNVTVIPAAADLNTYTSPGDYCASINNCTNTPYTGWQGYLEVVIYSAVGAGYVMQRATSIQADAWVHTRILLAGSWQPWQVLAGSNAPFTGGGMTAAQQLQTRKNIGAGAADVIVEEQYASGTSVTNAAAGSYATRALNTLVRNAGSIASLSANQVTLGAGTYYMKWQGTAFNVNAHKTRLQNITDASTVGIGSNEYSYTGAPAANASSTSTGAAVVTIASSKAFALQHRCGIGSLVGGWGNACSFGDTEVYARLEITQIA